MFCTLSQLYRVAPLRIVYFGTLVLLGLLHNTDLFLYALFFVVGCNPPRPLLLR
jgi:hypothetical protein